MKSWKVFLLLFGVALFFIVFVFNDKNKELIQQAQAGNLAEVGRLLKKGVKANARDGNDYTALYFAAYKGHKDVVLLLLEKGADVNAAGNTKYTPLHGAAMGGHKDIVELLILKGADMNARSAHGLTPLQETRNKEVIEVLMANGAK
jgi:ankyrin repeat protein